MSRLYRYFTYNIKFGCGHEGTLTLKFEQSDLSWYEKHGKCKECYKAEQERLRAEKKAEKEAELQATCKEVEMHYSEYKNKYADCNTKKDSYNANTKTIIVYVSAEKEAEIETDKAEDEAILAIADVFGYDMDIEKARKGIDKVSKDKEKDKDSYLAEHYRDLLYRHINAEDFEEAKTRERDAKLLEIRKNFQLKIGWIKE